MTVPCSGWPGERSERSVGAVVVASSVTRARVVHEERGGSSDADGLIDDAL